MTIKLAPWTDEPKLHSVLAVFGGDAPALEGFADAWAADGQPLTLPALRPGSRFVQKCWPGPMPKVALALQVSRPKRLWIHWWQLHATNWRLFYCPDTRPPNAGAGDVYLPWGHVASTPELKHRGITLVLNEQEMFSMPPNGTATSNLFHRFVDIGFSPPRPASPMAQLPLPPAVPVQLGLRLVEKLPPISTNPTRELERVQKRIRELQLVAGALQWQKREAQPPIELLVYPEEEQPEIATGTQWDLRDWLASASASDIAQLQHARVAVEGFQKSDGRAGNAILHLVAPASLGRSVAARLPRAGKTLVLELDRRWHEHELGGEVFVSKDHQLQPAVPHDNPSVVEEMARGLWDGGSRERDRILVFRWPLENGEARCLRVPKTEFKPLATQTVAFNMPVAAQFHRSLPAPTDFADLLTSVERSVTQAVDTHVKAMCKAIETCWNDTRPEVERARGVMHAALEEDRAFLADFKSWQTEIRQSASGVANNEWHRWTAFLSMLLVADRDSLPRSRARLAGWLGYLDGIRAELAKRAWEPDASSPRPELAERLRKLADTVERGIDVRP
jgi:hypothetical protein